MAFFDKTNARLPDELKDASQEELIEAIKFYKEGREKLTQTSAELETTRQTLANVETQFNDTRTRLSTLEANIAAENAKRQQPPPSPERSTDFFEDPEKAFNQRQGPRDMYMLETRAQVAQMNFEGGLLAEPGRFGDDPKVYKKYRNEVVDLIRREPLVNQANSQVWKNAFLLIKGLHSDEIADARKSQDAAFFGEQPKTAVSADTKPVDEVTDEDRRAAQRYGLTPEEILASRKTLKIMPVVS